MSKELFIGSRKIKATMDDPNDKEEITVIFKDGTKGKLKKKLYDIITREATGNGNSIQEVVNAYVGMKIIKELASYGYERYQIEGLAAAIGNLVHNLTEIKIGEKFGVNSSDNIKLSDIL